MSILQPFYINFEELKEGDVLYDIALQREMIVKHLFKYDKYAIVTKNLDSITYMKDGRRYDSDTHPRLLKRNPFQEEEKIDQEQKENKDTKNIYL